MKKIFALLLTIVIVVSGSISVSAAEASPNIETLKEQERIWQEDMRELEAERNRRLETREHALFSETFDYTTSNGNTITVSHGTARVGISTFASGEGSYEIDGPGDFYTWFEYKNFWLGTSGKIRGQMDYKVTKIVGGAPQLQYKSCSLTCTPPQGFKKEDQEFAASEKNSYWLRTEGYVTFTQDYVGVSLNYYPDIQIIGDNSPANTIDWYWSC